MVPGSAFIHTGLLPVLDDARFWVQRFHLSAEDLSVRQHAVNDLDEQGIRYPNE